MMSFQDVLPSTTPRYKYNNGGIDECVRVMGQEVDRYERESSEGTSNPYFIMDIDERSYLECFINSGEGLLLLSSGVYNHASQSTIVEVGSPTHVAAVGALNETFLAWHSFYDTSIVNMGTAGFRGETISKKGAIPWVPEDPSSGKLPRLAKFGLRSSVVCTTTKTPARLSNFGSKSPKAKSRS